MKKISPKKIKAPKRGTKKTAAIPKAGNNPKSMPRSKAAPIDFLSIAAHQLRAPLTLMKGYLSMMLEGEFGDIKEKRLSAALGIVYQSSERLARLVENLLDMSRLENGKLKLFRETGDMGTLAEEAVREFRSKASAKGLALEFVRPAEKITASVDLLMIRQVLSNLIDNAIKYTPQGKVMVAVAKRVNKTVFSVSDTGPGLLKTADLKKLFKKFSRPNDDPSGQSGFGLGLYICRLIVEAHKGKIRAELPKSGGLKIVFEI